MLGAWKKLHASCEPRWKPLISLPSATSLTPTCGGALQATRHLRARLESR